MTNRRSVLALLAAAPALPFLARPAMAMEPEVFSDGGLAIRGTDPVAYFREGAAVAGDASHQLMWHGATWTFASTENMLAFEMNPDAYAPQFGGYCAFALAQGALASTDPQAWTINEGKLYLNYSLGVRDRWSTDIPGNVAKAEGFWPDILWS
jgi:YHS domain-containing protein